MGAVDRARDTKLSREVAIKMLPAALNHAHIAEGETLEQKLKSGALPVEDSLRLALQIVEALEAAHGQGVIHRDLRPVSETFRCVPYRLAIQCARDPEIPPQGR